MTIFRSAYDTFACSNFVMTKILHAVETVLYTGHLQPVPGGTTLELIGGGAVDNAVPAFAHPFVFTRKEEGAGDAVVIDARAYGKFDPHKAAFVIRNKTEYEFLVLRGRLNNCWVKESPSLLMNVSPLAMKLFAAWISENITKKFLLDPREATVLQVYAAFYYCSLFMDQHALTSTDKHKITAAIVKSTGINAQMVVEIVEHFEAPIAGVMEFCRLAGEVVESIRLAQLNVGVLYAILGSTWFNSNGKEVVTVALEHPPTWIAMIDMASQDRSFKNSAVNKLLERLDRRDKGQTLMRAVKATLDAAEA